MSALDNIKALLRANGHIEAQSKETLVKCFEQIIGTSSTLLSSPKGSITVTAGSPTTVEVSGLAPDDLVTNLGASLNRWRSLDLGPTGFIAFDNGLALHKNYLQYSDAIGPAWEDGTTSYVLQHNVQSLTQDRGATWQDEDGTVAWLHNCFTTVQTITTANAGSVVMGINEASSQHYCMKAAGNIAGFTITMDDGTFEGQRVIWTFNHDITTLTLGGSNMLSTWLTPPAVITGPATVGWVWKNSEAVTGWLRYQ